MKVFRKLLFLTLSLGIFVSIIGCEAAMLVAETAKFGMDMAAGVASIHKEVTRADVKMSVAANIDKAITASEKSLRKLKIGIEDKKIYDKHDAAIIKGSTGKYTIQIAIAKISPESCEIGVWAKQGPKREPEYASLIAQTIKDRLENQGFKTGEITETEKKPAKGKRKS
jgi:hypothetical protein